MESHKTRTSKTNTCPIRESRRGRVNRIQMFTMIPLNFFFFYHLKKYIRRSVKYQRTFGFRKCIDGRMCADLYRYGKTCIR